MSNYSYINIRIMSAKKDDRNASFERILKQCVEKALGPPWVVALTEHNDDGPVWAVTLPGTAKPEGSKPRDPPAMCPSGEDIGFPVALQQGRIAFRSVVFNLFCDWAQGCVAEQLSDYYGKGIFHDATSRTQRAGTKEYRRGKTFREYLMRNFTKPLKPDDAAWIEEHKRFAPKGHW